MAVKQVGKKSDKHKFGISLAIIQLLLTVGCIGCLFALDILNPIIVIAAGIVLLGIGGVILKTQFSDRSHIVGKVFSIIISGVLVILLSAILQATSMLDTVTDKGYDIDKMSVIVLKEDAAETIEDVLDYQIAVLKKDTGVEGEKAAKAVEWLEEKYNVEINLIGYREIDILVEGLYWEDSVQAIIVNSAMITTIEENYDDFSEKTKVVGEIELKTESANSVAKKTLEEPFHVFISGIDVYGDISTNSRSDVNIIATVNPATGQVLLTTTPRDYYVKIPGVSSGRKDKLTHAGIYGVQKSMETLEALYDIDIEYYVRVNFSGLENIVDAVGGITVYSEYEFSTHLSPHYHYEKGYNEMNGKEALWFARDRKSVPGGERQRGKNQQQVIKGLVDKITSPAVLMNYSKLLNAVGESVQMNFSEAQIMNFLKNQLKKGTDWNIISLSADGTDARDYCYSYSGSSLYVMYPDYDTIDYIKNVMNKVYNGEILTEADENGLD